MSENNVDCGGFRRRARQIDAEAFEALLIELLVPGSSVASLPVQGDQNFALPAGAFDLLDGATACAGRLANAAELQELSSS